MEHKEELEKLASYVRLAWDRSLTESTGGNMSLRIKDKVYITPTMFVKHFFSKPLSGPGPVRGLVVPEKIEMRKSSGHGDQEFAVLIQ